jgi:hypothetical protein
MADIFPPDADLTVYWLVAFGGLAFACFVGWIYAQMGRVADSPWASPLVSEQCPTCGSTEYTKLRPEATRITFAADRKCKGCATRYAIPTPGWASVLLVVAGVTLIASGLCLGLVIGADSKSYRTVFGCSMVFGVIGFGAIRVGVRAIFQSAKKGKD